MPTLFNGKYRAEVRENQDPLARARLKVLIPDVAPQREMWAEACLPVQGDSTAAPACPPIGTLVWVEFERGNPSRPVYVGELFRSSAPPSPTIPSPAERFSIEQSDSGVLSLRVDGVAIVTLESGSVRVANGAGATIALLGPQVSINNGALEVL